MKIILKFAILALVVFILFAAYVYFNKEDFVVMLEESTKELEDRAEKIVIDIKDSGYFHSGNKIENIYEYLEYIKSKYIHVSVVMIQHDDSSNKLLVELMYASWDAGIYNIKLGSENEAL